MENSRLDPTGEREVEVKCLPAKGRDFWGMLKFASERQKASGHMYGESCSGDLVVQVFWDGRACVFRLERQLSAEEVERLVRAAK